MGNVSLDQVLDLFVHTYCSQLPLMPRVPSIQHLLALFSTVGRIERAEYQYAGGVVIQFDTAETADAAICMTMP